ncbi:MAG TPA: Hsp20/alpha crystallin family protein [Blastocatellia bacterium]
MAGAKSEKQGQGTQSTAMRNQRGGLARTSSLFPPGAREFMGYGPFEMMRRFSEEMDRAVGHMFEDLGLSQEGGAREMMAWSPAVEVFERDNNMIVRAELPGMSKDDINVEMTDDGLLIHGERKREKEEKGKGWYRSERSYGEFRRLIPMPEGVNTEDAKASFENGVLEITAPMRESSRRKRSVPIEIGGAQAARTAGGSSKR